MKTKITTIIGLVSLGIIGFTSNNATAANNLMSSFATVEAQENITLENWMLNSYVLEESSEAKTEKIEAAKPLEVVEGMTNEDFLKAAESYTASGADKEIEKYANQQIENSIAKTETDKDFFNTAESFTASGSENEVKNYATKIIALENERMER